MRRSVRSMIFSIIFILLGICGLFFYIFPLFVRGNVNIGTVTGIVIFGLFTLYGIFKPIVDKAVKRLCRKRIGKVFLAGLSVIVVGIIITAVILSHLMFSAIRSKPKGNVTVIVLGCAVLPSGNPSLMLRERLDAAYDYLIDNPDAKCILCGGQGDDEVMTEAQCMFNYLTDKGIDESRLYLEHSSTSTRENIMYALQIIGDQHLPQSIAIVTNEFHEYRANRIATELGVTSYAISANTAWWLFPTYYVRELYGILYEIII